MTADFSGSLRFVFMYFILWSIFHFFLVFVSAFKNQLCLKCIFKLSLTETNFVKMIPERVYVFRKKEENQ